MPKSKAICFVPEDQLSLAIGKEGQNVRLAAKLTGWKIDVRSLEGADQEPTAVETTEGKEEKKDKQKKKESKKKETKKKKS